MRKAKVIAVLALTVVMLAATTGLAGAVTTITVGEQFVTMPPDSSKDVNIEITNSGSTDLTYTCGFWTGSSGIISGTFTPNSIFVASGNTESVTLTITAASGSSDGEYSYVVSVADYSTQENIAQSSSAYVGIVKIGIPEFTTIAIPVASILGLLFFFNHRKHKKE